MAIFVGYAQEEASRSFRRMAGWPMTRSAGSLKAPLFMRTPMPFVLQNLSWSSRILLALAACIKAPKQSEVIAIKSPIAHLEPASSSHDQLRTCLSCGFATRIIINRPTEWGPRQKNGRESDRLYRDRRSPPQPIHGTLPLDSFERLFSLTRAGRANSRQVAKSHGRRGAQSNRW